MMQPHPMTSVMQLSVTVSAVAVAAAAISFTAWTWTQERNARLVEIGVSVLRVDPAKERQVAAAREWALNIIDANSGGVTFSEEARRQLLEQPLASTGWYTFGYGYYYPSECVGSDCPRDRSTAPARITPPPLP